MMRGHAEALMPLIAEVMSAAGVEFSELDRIAVTVGPGSFTGLRVGVAAARGIALAAGTPAIGLTTLSVLAAPFFHADESKPLLAVIDARHSQVYMQLFGPGGRSLIAPRLATVRDAVRAAMASPTRIVGNAARLIEQAWPEHERRPALVNAVRAPDIGWVARLGAATSEYVGAAEAALPARSRCASPGGGHPAAAMIYPFFLFSPFVWFEWMFGRQELAISSAGVADAAQFAALHGAAFRRGWSIEEFERLLLEPNVVADRAMAGSRLGGFVLSRLAADQAEILSIVVAADERRHGVGRKLLEVHMRRLARYGVTSLFLEVDERNTAARRLYAGFGFGEVGRRNSYYIESGSAPGAALVLRRELT